jgi:DnaJ homolog subfamily C member 9
LVASLPYSLVLNTDRCLELHGRKRKNSQENDLILAISQRRAERKKQFNSILSNIMSKCDSKASSSEPTEEEFEQAQQTLESRRAKRRKSCCYQPSCPMLNIV